MTDNDVVEILQSCRSVFINLHNKVGHSLSEQEIAQLEKFKVLWEDGLCCNPKLVEEAGMKPYELAFLGGYICFGNRMITN